MLEAVFCPQTLNVISLWYIPKYACRQWSIRAHTSWYMLKTSVFPSVEGCVYVHKDFSTCDWWTLLARFLELCRALHSCCELVYYNLTNTMATLLRPLAWKYVPWRLRKTTNDREALFTQVKQRNASGKLSRDKTDASRYKTSFSRFSDGVFFPNSR